MIKVINDINLNYYKIFYICCKCSSFVNASKKLYISQPAISKAIMKLEQQLGTKLFYRDRKGLTLTSDGKNLYEYIDKSYNYLMAGEKLIREKNDVNVGTIVIGSPAHIASFYLLDYIEKYHSKHPNVFFRIINGSTTELIKGLEEHTIDFVIDSSPINVSNKDIEVVYLKEFETCFISSKRNDSLKDNLYVMPYERSNMRINLEKELDLHNISVKVALEVETTDLIISSVKKGMGAGYVVKKAVQEELEKEELFEIKTKFALPKLRLNLVYVDQYLTNLSRYFIKNHINKL